MHPDRSVPEQKLDLPPDLVAEVKKARPSARIDMGVEGLKHSPSFFGRLVEMLSGRR